MKIAVIGSGIAGLGSAYLAHLNGHQVHLFESANYFGGHSNTIDVHDGNTTFPVDTGFLVHNPKTYPNLIQFFEDLGVETTESQMSLSVQVPDENLEWAGANLRTVFGQMRNLLRLPFYRMLLDILKFNREAPAYLKSAMGNPDKTLGNLMTENHFSRELASWYLVPMAAAIWSTPANKILEFPAYTFLRFCLNHNLLQVKGRPVWRTVAGGSREYVKKIVDLIQFKYMNTKIHSVRREKDLVILSIDGQAQFFDQMIFATPADYTRRILTDLTDEEDAILSCFHYQPNAAVVHTDVSFLPSRKTLWSAWNYISSPRSGRVSVSYLINHLQKLPTQLPIIVTLNPHKEIPPGQIIRRIEYRHPVLDKQTIKAQVDMNRIQGIGNVYYAGAWLGYGFHEDGLKAALRIGRQLGWRIPWSAEYE